MVSVGSSSHFPTPIVSSLFDPIVDVAGSAVFALFPRLPPELYRIIWKNACLFTRVVDVWTTPIQGKKFGDFTIEFDKRQMKSNHHNTPAILHTSHEARLVGLEHYILSFGSKVTGRIGDGTTEIAIPAPISYDKGWDILCPMENLDVFDNIQESPLYTGDHFMKDLLKEAEADKKKFKTIAFDAGKSFSIMWAAQFATFAGCKEIVAYCCPETLIRRYGSATPLNLDYISLNEDMDQKLAAADIDAVFKEIFVYIGEHFEKYKG